MKKILALLLCLAMLLSLVACGDDSSAVNDLPDEKIEAELENPDENVVDEFDVVVDTPDVSDTPDNDTKTEYSETDDYSVCSVSNDDFTLTLEGKNTYKVGEEIYFEARVTLNNAESLTVYSSDPILSFGLEGDKYFNDGQGAATINSVLMIYEFSNAEEYIYPLTKSGGWAASDPDADFYNQFFSNSEYTLPEGSYKVYVVFDYSTDENDMTGTKHSFIAACDFSVVDESESEGLSTQVTYYFEDDSSITCYPDDEQAEQIYAAVINGEWIQSLSDCITDYLIVVNGNEYHYHSDCGTVNDYANMCCKTLDKETKAELNEILCAVVSSAEK